VIQFKCACCGQLLQLGDEWAGKVCKCPFSGQFMQVPALSAASMTAPGGAGGYSPFAGMGGAPPAPGSAPATAGPEFGDIAGTRAADLLQRGKQKSKYAIWQSRGALLGALGGAVIGILFAAIFGALGGSGKTTAELLAGSLSVILGGLVLGAGSGGVIGPLLLLAMDKGPKKWSGTGAVMGALYGLVRVAGFGAIGGLVPGFIRGALILMIKSDVGEAVQDLVLTALLTAMTWAAVGAFIGAAFGAARGGLGGYQE
jgi:hypothetical protein